MGVYALFLNEELMYIGQCEDFGKRYNQGYGQISPRNCFVGGQSTNCKINKFIFDSTRKGEIIKLYFLETNSYDKIESELIELYKPILNHQKGKNINKNIPKNKEKTENKIENAKIQKQCGVDDVYNYLINLVDEAKNNNLEYLEIISGNIHRELNLSERMPTVCNAMYKLKKDDDEIIFSPPKGRGSKLHIRYFL